MKGMHVIAVAALLAATAAGGFVAGAQQAESAERTLKVNQVARVGEGIITAEQFIEKLNEIEQPLLPDLRNSRTALDMLVAERLLDLETDRLEAAPKAREIGDEMEAVEKQFRAAHEQENAERLAEQRRRGLPERPQPWDEFLLARMGMTPKEFSGWLRSTAARNLRMRLLVGYWEETTEHAEAYGVRVDSRDAAAALRERFIKGEDFRSLARSSTEGRSRDFDGRIGMVWKGDGRLDGTVDEAFWKLKDGELSEPVRTEHGWWLVLRRRTVLANEAPFYDLREQLISRTNVDNNRFQAWRNATAASGRYVFERRMPGWDVGADQE